MSRGAFIAALCVVVIGAGCEDKSPKPTQSTAPAGTAQAGPNAAESYRSAWGKVDTDLHTAASFLSFNASGLKVDEGSKFTRVDEITGVLQSHQDVINELMKAGAQQSCDFGFKVDAKNLEQQMPGIIDVSSSMRKAARVLRADAGRAWMAGDIDGAVDRVVALYAMSGHAADEPVLIISLTNGAVIGLANDVARTMAAGVDGKSLNAEQKARLLAAVERLDRNDPAGMVRARKVDKPNDAAAEQTMDQSQLKLTSDLATTRRALGGN